nr:PAS domain S-box protein [Magnetospirillum sulfuroxidans]
MQLRDALHRASLREFALSASEQRLSSIFATSEAAIVLSDSLGQVMQANDAFLRLIGADEALDLHMRTLTHADDRLRESLLQEPMINGQVNRYRLDKRFVRHDGSCIWVDASVRAIRNGNNPPHQFVTVAIDISERVRAEQDLRFIRALVDQSADPIYCMDPHDGGRMVWVNAATCRHFGKSAAELMAMRIPDWDPNFNSITAETLWNTPELHNTRILETTHRAAGGDIIAVEVSASWLEHDGRSYIAGYIRDIRDRNRMLAAVRRSNEDLQQFAYVASHDLQEPLRMVASFLQLLERRYGERLDAAGREYIQFAVDGAIRMKQLIEDLLAYSRIDSRGMQPKSVDLTKIIQAACDNLVSAFADSGGRISYPPDLPHIMGDETQLVRLLQNLIGNALKYRAADRFPEITVSAHRQADTWIISIQDNGIGISPEYHDRIFMIFQRLHGIGAYEGTGIGLAICKRIVERHGGEIWVQSQENTGSTFNFTVSAVDTEPHQ